MVGWGPVVQVQWSIAGIACCVPSGCGLLACLIYRIARLKHASRAASGCCMLMQAATDCAGQADTYPIRRAGGHTPELSGGAARLRDGRGAGQQPKPGIPKETAF